MIQEPLEFFNQNQNPRRRLQQPFPTTFSTFRFHSDLPWLRVNMPSSIDLKKVLSEAQALADVYVHHRSGGGHDGWSSICLHGLAADKTQGYEHYGFKDDQSTPYDWTEIATRCPETVKLLQSLHYKKFYRVRFMRLAPGGYVLPHSDDSVRQTGALNIALNQPEGCEMVMDGWGKVPVEEGFGYIFDISNIHSLWNRSQEYRYHIIIHGERDEQWEQVGAENLLRAQLDTPVSTKNTSISLNLNALSYIDRDLRFFDHYNLNHPLPPSAPLFEKMENVFFSPQSLHSLTYKLMRSHLSGLVDDLQVDDFQVIHNLENPVSAEIISPLNCIYILLTSKDEPLEFHFSAFTYHDDGADNPQRIDLDYHNKKSIGTGMPFCLNTNMKISIATDSEFFLVRLLPKAKISARHTAENILAANTMVDPKNHPLIAACMDRAIKGFNINERILNLMGSQAIHHYTLAPDVKIFVTRSATLSEEDNRFFYEQRTAASLMPLPHELINEADLDERLRTLDKSFKIVAVIANGNYIHSLCGMTYELSHFGHKMIRDNVAVTGHIMDFQGRDGSQVPYLHPQFVLLNMEMYHQLGQPPLADQQHTGDFPAYQASEEKFHDHYTPHFLNPASNSKTVHGHFHFASELLARSLEHGHMVRNFSEEFRSFKSFAYPENKTKRETFRQNKFVLDRYNQVSSQVYAINVHDLKLTPHPVPFEPDHLICVAAGFNPLLIKRRFPSIQKITLFDRSFAALQYWRDLASIETLPDLIFRVLLEMSPNKLEDESFNMYVKSQLQRLIDLHFDGHESELFAALREFRNCQLVSRDLIALPESVGDLVSPGDKPLVWISNIYYANINSLMFSQLVLDQSYKNLVKQIADHLECEAVTLVNETRTLFTQGVNKEVKGLIIDDRGVTTDLWGN